MKSKEYPDLEFVKPASFTAGRDYEILWIVIHTTEGSAHSRSAEDGAAYDAKRTDGTSTHFFVDSDSVVQCVLTTDRAHTARVIANNRGVQFELCGTAKWSKEQWAGPYQLAMLENAARQAAKVAKKYNIQAKWLTKEEVQNRSAKGFVTHNNVTQWLEGTHTDPGPNFPFTYFMERVSYYLKLLNVPEKTSNNLVGTKPEGVEVKFDLSRMENHYSRKIFSPEGKEVVSNLAVIPYTEFFRDNALNVKLVQGFGGPESYIQAGIVDFLVNLIGSNSYYWGQRFNQGGVLVARELDSNSIAILRELTLLAGGKWDPMYPIDTFRMLGYTKYYR